MNAATTYVTGVAAEQQALKHLKQLGYALVAERYRNAYGEIDLIVQKDSQLCFVEVKARKQIEAGMYALQPRQQKRIWQCAEMFLADHPHYQSYAMQIDLIVIAGSQLHHEANIVWGE